LAGKVRVKVFGAGEVVVRQGDGGDSLFLVKHGSVNVYVDDAPAGTLGEGEIFGEMSLLTGEKRKATVAAAQETWLVEISKEDIEPLIKEDPSILDRLSMILARREESNIERRNAMEFFPADGNRKDAFREKLKAFFNL
jgi:CRP-like cAMP-binding protein